MATTVKKTQIKLYLNDGKTALINLPAPVSNDLNHPDNGEALIPAAWRAIQAAYASDSGATPVSSDYTIITTTNDIIAEDYYDM